MRDNFSKKQLEVMKEGDLLVFRIPNIIPHYRRYIKGFIGNNPVVDLNGEDAEIPREQIIKFYRRFT